MTFDEILGNAELNDDFEVAVGDNKFKLGDLRSLRGERDSLRTERDALSGDRDRYRTEYEKQSQNMANLIAEAGARAKAEVEAPPQVSPQEAFMDSLRKLTAPADPSQPLFEDKMFGAAFNRLRDEVGTATDAKLKSLTEQLNSLKGTLEDNLKTIASAHLTEREQRWWYDNRAEMPKIEGKPLSLEQIKEYASRNGIVYAGTNIIDYDRALDQITAPIRARQELEKAQEEAYQKGLVAGRTGKGQVLPFMSERSGGASDAPRVNTKGRNPRDFMKEAVTNGLRDVVAGNE